MTNTNCLEGVACPQCGQEDAIDVVSTHWVQVTDDGTDFTAHDNDEEYGDDSPALCPDCTYAGKWGDFTKKEH